MDWVSRGSRADLTRQPQGSTADYDDLLRQPWMKARWGPSVIEPILSPFAQSGRDSGARLSRTRDGYEVGLLRQASVTLWAIELRLTAHP